MTIDDTSKANSPTRLGRTNDTLAVGVLRGEGAAGTTQQIQEEEPDDPCRDETPDRKGRRASLRPALRVLAERFSGRLAPGRLSKCLVFKVLDSRQTRSAGVYGNRTHWEPYSNPPTVLKTVASASRANTPE